METPFHAGAPHIDHDPAYQGPSGLDMLVGATQMTQQADAGPPAPAPPAGEPVPVGAEHEEPLPDAGEGAHEVEWPKSDHLKANKIQAARTIHKGNPPAHHKLNGWAPPGDKPTKNELWYVLLERNPTLRPKNWSVETMVKTLSEMEAQPAAQPAAGAVPVPGGQRIPGGRGISGNGAQHSEVFEDD